VKRITYNAKRRLTVSEDEGTFVIKESTHSGPSVHAADHRRRWSDDRIAVSLEELRAILAYAEAENAAKR